jgi:hypothetical protein
MGDLRRQAFRTTPIRFVLGTKLFVGKIGDNRERWTFSCYEELANCASYSCEKFIHHGKIGDPIGAYALSFISVINIYFKSMSTKSILPMVPTNKTGKVDVERP